MNQAWDRAGWLVLWLSRTRHLEKNPPPSKKNSEPIYHGQLQFTPFSLKPHIKDVSKKGLFYHDVKWCNNVWVSAWLHCITMKSHSRTGLPQYHQTVAKVNVKSTQICSIKWTRPFAARTSENPPFWQHIIKSTRRTNATSPLGKLSFIGWKYIRLTGWAEVNVRTATGHGAALSAAFYHNLGHFIELCH